MTAMVFPVFQQPAAAQPAASVANPPPLPPAAAAPSPANQSAQPAPRAPVETPRSSTAPALQPPSDAKRVEQPSRSAPGKSRRSEAKVPPQQAVLTESGPLETEVDSKLAGNGHAVKRCRVCSHSNPADAIYCFFDGTFLSTKHQPQVSHVGGLAFPTPFYFADGSICENFNQLAFGCNNHWDEARDHLAQGNWPTFFGGIGRMDLVAAAKQAAQEPDPDRGLCELLAKLPAESDFLRPPELALPSEAEDLGRLDPGADRKFELTIINQGMLLLQGVIWTKCDWLVFGDRAGVSEKVFQTRNFYTLAVHVPGDKIRAGKRPLKGEIVIETNGGNMTLPVTANVPVRPFPSGADGNNFLAAAKSPGELAVKAREHPEDAAVLFEEGVVKDWYAINGWTYPVEGAAASGKAAVQQFFEALGLTKPPRLQMKNASLTLTGKMGQRLSRCLTIHTEESKPVYATAWSNQEWVEVGPNLPLGKTFKILVEVLVPPNPGDTLFAEIGIRGNGKQNFTVPVQVTVEKED